MKNLLFLLTALCLLAAMPARQVLPTSLRITVLDESGNAVPQATVTLYADQAGYDKETGPVQPAQATNAKGTVIFRNLEARIYHVRAVKDDLDNSGGATQTSPLKAGTMNKVNIIVE